MSTRVRRLLAIIRADFLIRLRRPSTAVVFLLLSALPYLWIPDPSTGRALMQIAGRRALYNSAAIGMATAALGAIFVGLFGFYVVSNALGRDVQSRCGYVIASTTMRGSEYLAGKFAGNATFLTVFMLGFMATSMAMVLVRGEAPLEPWLFAKHYLLLTPAAIVFVSATAVVFEATPLLRSRAGDVFYFFFWLFMMAAAVLVEKNAGAVWMACFDVSGFGVVQQQMKTYFGVESLSIGSMPFDPAKGVIAFEGLRLTPYWAATRLAATLWPIALLAVARLFFHRFDPARLRAAGERARTSWLGRFNALAKPVASLFVRVASSLVPASTRPTLLGSALVDALTTIAAFPLAVVAVLAFGVASLAASAGAMFTAVLPIAYAVCAVAISDIACREKRAGTTALVFAAPSLRSRFVLWKFLSAFFVALFIGALPLARAVALRPTAALPLLVGLAFTTAAATALGIASANPKTFIVAFLSFWYVATQDKGTSPSLDFAGFFGTATPMVIAAYAALALALLTAAHLLHARELRRTF